MDEFLLAVALVVVAIAAVLTDAVRRRPTAPSAGSATVSPSGGLTPLGVAGFVLFALVGWIVVAIALAVDVLFNAIGSDGLTGWEFLMQSALSFGLVAGSTFGAITVLDHVERRLVWVRWLGPRGAGVAWSLLMMVGLASVWFGLAYVIVEF